MPNPEEKLRKVKEEIMELMGIPESYFHNERESLGQVRLRYYLTKDFVQYYSLKNAKAILTELTK